MKENIPVIILCGGKGSRLKEETEFRPKPMVTIGGKPILWHIMKIYQHFGFNKFIIALGYKGKMISDYFKRKENAEFDVKLIDTGLATLTGERVLRLKNYIDAQRFMVTYGDGIGDVNIKKLVKFHAIKYTIGTITGVHPISKWGLIIRDTDGRVISFKQKPKLDEFVNGGFMIFDKSFFEYLRTKEMIEDAFLRVIREKQLSVYLHNGFWRAMDTYQDMDELNKLWEDDPRWKVWESNHD